MPASYQRKKKSSRCFKSSSLTMARLMRPGHDLPDLYLGFRNVLFVVFNSDCFQEKIRLLNEEWIRDFERYHRMTMCGSTQFDRRRKTYPEKVRTNFLISATKEMLFVVVQFEFVFRESDPIVFITRQNMIDRVHIVDGLENRRIWIVTIQTEARSLFRTVFLRRRWLLNYQWQSRTHLYRSELLS